MDNFLVKKFFYLLLLNIGLHSTFVWAQLSNATPYFNEFEITSGKLKVYDEKSVIDPYLGVLINDNSSYIKDLYSGKELTLDKNNSYKLIVRNSNFTKFVLQNKTLSDVQNLYQNDYQNENNNINNSESNSYSNNNNNYNKDLYLAHFQNSKVKILQKIKKIPIYSSYSKIKNQNVLNDTNSKYSDSSNQNLSNYMDRFRFQFSSDEKYLIALSESELWVYSFGLQTWKLAQSNFETHFRFESIDTSYALAFSPSKPDSFIVKKTSTLNGFSVSYLKFDFQDLENPKVLDLFNANSFFTAERFLVSIDPTTGDTKVYDIISQAINTFKLDTKLDLVSEFPKPLFFTTSDGHIGCFSVYFGLKIFNIYGIFLKEYNFTRVSKYNISYDGRYVFIENGDENQFYFLDLKLDKKVILPQIFKLKFLKSSDSALVLSEKLYIQGSQVYEVSLESLINNPENLFYQPMTDVLQKNTLLVLNYIENPSLFRSVPKDLYETICSSDEYLKKAEIVISLLPKFISQLTGNDFNIIKKYLNSFEKLFLKWTHEKREQFIESLGVEFVENIRVLKTFEDISPSKFANIMIELLKPLVHLPSEGRTDIALIRQNDESIIPIIFATDLIDNDPTLLTHYGYYMKKLSPIKIGIKEDFSHMDFEWVFKNKLIKTQGQARFVRLNNLVNKSDSPPYDNLWKNKKLTGVFILGSNLLDDFDVLTSKIISYYRDEGFSFGIDKLKLPEKKSSMWDGIQRIFWFPKTVEKIIDAKQWLREKIETGELDYLVKEAHSSGRDELIWLANQNNLIKGFKKLSNGMTEEIYILYPQSLNYEFHGFENPIKNYEFGSWLRTREYNKNNELVYINASCWSKSDALNELVAAQSRLLIEIPTYGTTLTFENKWNNHERGVVDSLRKGLTYSEIKTRLEKFDKKGNPFIFPNDAIYDEWIWSKIPTALEYNFDLKKDH